MVSSNRQMIVRILLLLTAIVSANAQPAADKSSTSTISGKVTIGGAGFPGLVVGLAIATPSSSIHVTRLRGVTDEEGNYRIKVPPGTYEVLVSAPQYVQSERTSVVVGTNEVVENIDIALTRGGVITGRVTDAEGRPVIEEEMSFTSSTPSRGLPYMRTIRTDDRGVYRAFGLPPGRYTVAAGRNSTSAFGGTGVVNPRTYYPSTANAAEATAVEVNEGSEATNVDIRLGRPLSKYTARGRIIDGETSQPLPNAHIGIQVSFDIQGAIGFTSRPDAAESTKDGEFKIEGLPPGRYAVYLGTPTDSESFSETVRFEVTDRDIEGLLIKTSKGGTASGIIVLEGTHGPTVRATLAKTPMFPSVSNESRPVVSINPDGTFRLTNLPAGRLTLSLSQNQDHLRVIRIERDGVAYPRGIEIREREQITGLRVIVSQANGIIRGVLKLPEGMALPATARLIVSVRRMEGPTGYNPTVTVDARGQFIVPDLVAGTYEFNVSVTGIPGDQRLRIPRPVQTVVVTNGAIADVTLTLQMPQTGPSGP